MEADARTLEELASDLESDRVERKADLTPATKKAVCEAICAFANDLPTHGLPGYVFIGIDDAGRPTGLTVTDALLRELADIRSSGKILPIPSMNVARAMLQGTDVAVIEAMPALYPPVRCDGVVRIRTGPRRDIASLQDEIRLTERRQHGDLPFDKQPAWGTDISDLDLKLAEEVYIPAAISPETLALNARTIEQRLASLRLITPDMALPTWGGIIVLGKDPLAWIGGCYVEFIRFEGTDITDPVRARHRLDGNLIAQLRRLDDLLPLYIETHSRPGPGLRRLDQPSYPAWALREFIINAMIHRNYQGTAAYVRANWYNDRVEIQNPGGLYGCVTPENFGTINDYRNETLAVAAANLRYVERVGQGVARARRALAENGNPEPEFDFQPEYVRVTVRAVDLG